MKHIPKHVNILNSIRDRNTNRVVPISILQKINNMICLYEDRRITQLITAENLIKGIETSNEKLSKLGVARNPFSFYHVTRVALGI